MITCPNIDSGGKTQSRLANFKMGCKTVKTQQTKVKGLPNRFGVSLPYRSHGRQEREGCSGKIYRFLRLWRVRAFTCSPGLLRLRQDVHWCMLTSGGRNDITVFFNSSTFLSSLCCLLSILLSSFSLAIDKCTHARTHVHIHTCTILHAGFYIFYICPHIEDIRINAVDEKGFTK